MAAVNRPAQRQLVATTDYDPRKDYGEIGMVCGVSRYAVEAVVGEIERGNEAISSFEKLTANRFVHDDIWAT
jgi:hypothetical protein